jgi:hypothetical protein
MRPQGIGGGDNQRKPVFTRKIDIPIDAHYRVFQQYPPRVVLHDPPPA